MAEPISEIQHVDLHNQIPQLAKELKEDLAILAKASGEDVSREETKVRTKVDKLRRYVQEGQGKLKNQDIIDNGQSMIDTTEEYLRRVIKPVSEKGSQVGRIVMKPLGLLKDSET